MKSIDGLRGIAVLLVLLFHYLNNSYANSDVENLNRFEILLMKIASLGWIGVDLFFIISGFLIGKILLFNKKSAHFFKVFYIRRFLRIFPLYFVLLITYSISRYFFFTDDLVLFENSIPIENYFFLVQNFIMSIRGDFGPNALTPTWSLAVEEQFYLLIPLIIYYFSNKQIVLISMIFIVFAQFYRVNADNWYREYTHFISRADTLFLGVLLAIFQDKGISKFNMYFSKWYVKFLIFCLLFGLYFFNNSINHLLISFVFFVFLNFIIGLNSSSVLIRMLTPKWILFLGKYSFFIYLFHQIVNGILFVIFQGSRNPNLDSLESYTIGFFSLIVTFSMAHLSYLYFESKFISYGYRYKYFENNV